MSDVKVPRFLRMKQLSELGISKSYPDLNNKITRYGFPQGRYLGANTRVWTEDEVMAWLDSRPTTNPRTTR
jgi:predicted DNA-binding transcriptional regulator AlpA